MKKLICPICKRERKRSETMAICPNENDDRIVGRICKDGDCPRRAMIVRCVGGYAIIDRLTAVAARDSVAAEVSETLYKELPRPSWIGADKFVFTGHRHRMDKRWRQSPTKTIDDFVAERLVKKRGKG